MSNKININLDLHDIFLRAFRVKSTGNQPVVLTPFTRYDSALLLKTPAMSESLSRESSGKRIPLHRLWVARRTTGSCRANHSILLTCMRPEKPPCAMATGASPVKELQIHIDRATCNINRKEKVEIVTAECFPYRRWLPSYISNKHNRTNEKEAYTHRLKHFDCLLFKWVQDFS